MRNAARLKMGRYPLPLSEGIKLRFLLTYVNAASVIDACVGQGAALHLITSEASVRRYGIKEYVKFLVSISETTQPAVSTS